MNRMMKIIAGGLVLSAAIAAHAGANLIKNGTFEGTGSQNASWGAYATHSSFSCSNWEFYNSDDGGATKLGSTAGLCKPSSTWTDMTAAQIGSFALFIQASVNVNAPRTAYVEQSIGELPASVYRIGFKYATRPKNGDLPTYVEFVDAQGQVFAVATIRTTSTAAQTFSKDVFLPAGTYTFRFRQPFVGTDRSNVFEDVSVVRLDARIGEKGYIDLATALTAASTNDVIVYATTDDAQDASISGANIAWNGNMPVVQVPGTLTFSGANTIAAYASAPGTYTLFTANSIVMEEGATLALDSPVTDGLVRTLDVGANTVTLTVALDPARTEMVINGDFDIPGTSAGTANANAPSWSYSYPFGGFCVPWWNCYTSAAGGNPRWHLEGERHLACEPDA